jgi:hypothetical protein
MFLTTVGRGLQNDGRTSNKIGIPKWIVPPRRDDYIRQPTSYKTSAHVPVGNLEASKERVL